MFLVGPATAAAVAVNLMLIELILGGPGQLVCEIITRVVTASI